MEKDLSKDEFKKTTEFIHIQKAQNFLDFQLDYVLLKEFNVEIPDEQEIVYLITDSKISEAVATGLVKHDELSEKANLAVYMTYTDANLNNFDEKTEK